MTQFSSSRSDRACTTGVCVHFLGHSYLWWDQTGCEGINLTNFSNPSNINWHSASHLLRPISYLLRPTSPPPRSALGKPPWNCLQVQMGIAQMERGVSMLARMVWALGHLLREVQMGNLLDCGEVKMLARMIWGTYAVKIDVQMGICFC